MEEQVKKYLLCLGVIGAMITISQGATAVRQECAGEPLTPDNQKTVCDRICGGKWLEPNMASLLRCKTDANPLGFACDCQ